MDLNLKGHVAIVQGASRGIGRGIAESLAAEGVNLILSSRGQEALEATAGEIRSKHGVKAEAMAGDSSDLDHNGRLLDRAGGAFGRLDILVCNSGGPRPGGFQELDAEAWREAANLLVVAPADLLLRALPLLRQSPSPRFFVVTSSATRVPVPGLTLSNTFRPGLVGLVKSLTEELAADHVLCHSIAPGPIHTDRLSTLAKRQGESRGVNAEDVLAGIEKNVPAGRLGAPKDLGDLVAFLASERASYLAGGNWLVDGGTVRAI